MRRTELQACGRNVFSDQRRICAMQFTVFNAPLFADTAGQPLRPQQPTAVWIHGVACDHSVWSAQTQALAVRSWNVLALDLPGHGQSGGEAPSTVQHAADAVVALLDAAGVQRAALVGHSWGSLIALEAAARLQTRASHLVLVGTAHPMRVSPALLEGALTQPLQTLETVALYSRSAATPQQDLPLAQDPTLLLGLRVLASNPNVNVLHRGLVACNQYRDGLTALATVRARVLVVRGLHDRMTPPKAALPLVDGAQAAGLDATVVDLDAGHNPMSQAPDALLAALLHFLG